MQELQKETKKRKFEKTVTAKHWKNECNQKTINFCRIVFLRNKTYLKIMSYVCLPFGLIQKDKQIK